MSILFFTIGIFFLLCSFIFFLGVFLLNQALRDAEDKIEKEAKASSLPIEDQDHWYEWLIKL